MKPVLAMSVIDLVRQTLRQHGLADPDTRVIIAISGGSDSVALTELAHDLHAAGDLRVIGLAHFNHQLRAEALRDETCCRDRADRLGWPILIDREDVAARARRERRSTEDAARAARYEFFDRARAHFSADVVALGHTKDDQAETFLLRLLRGSGARGLASMYPRNGWVVRPLLDCRRADLRALLDIRQIPFVDDETNGDVSIPRNRVRAELLPLLVSRFNPQVVEALATEADLAREQWAWMAEAVAALQETAVKPIDEGAERLLTIDCAALRSAHPALRRMVVWTAMNDAARGRPVAFDHVATALRLISGETGDFDAPGQRVERVDDRLVLRSRPPGTIGRWRAGKPSEPFGLPVV